MPTLGGKAEIDLPEGKQHARPFAAGKASRGRSRSHENSTETSASRRRSADETRKALRTRRAFRKARRQSPNAKTGATGKELFRPDRRARPQCRHVRRRRFRQSSCSRRREFRHPRRQDRRRVLTGSSRSRRSIHSYADCATRHAHLGPEGRQAQAQTRPPLATAGIYFGIHRRHDAVPQGGCYRLRGRQKLQDRSGQYYGSGRDPRLRHRPDRVSPGDASASEQGAATEPWRWSKKSRQAPSRRLAEDLAALGAESRSFHVTAAHRQSDGDEAGSIAIGAMRSRRDRRRRRGRRPIGQSSRIERARPDARHLEDSRGSRRFNS